MKIALCSSDVPFANGGARNIVDWLEIMLRRAGQQVEKVYLPHLDDPEQLFRQMAGYRWVDLTESADRIVCFRPPAHFIRHPHKILWFIHHIRSFYDLWDTPYRHFPDSAVNRGIRDALRAADTRALGEARAVFTNSRIVSSRLRQFNGVDSTVLYPPVLNSERFHCRSQNDEVVIICRMEPAKRQHLLLEAMRHTLTPVRLRLCGNSLGKEYGEQLRRAIAAGALEDRVTLEYGWITEERKVELLSDCLAAAYVPFDEDSYGYFSLEASHAAKPILTTTDSGGVLELVEHGVNGLVAEPSPGALAEALDQLYSDRNAARYMGERARTRLAELRIDWANVLELLLA